MPFAQLFLTSKVLSHAFAKSPILYNDKQVNDTTTPGSDDVMSIF